MIYLVTVTIPYEGTYTTGAYSTRELAEKALNEFDWDDSDIMEIRECLIDQPCCINYSL